MSKNDAEDIDEIPLWQVHELPRTVADLLTVARDARVLIHKFAETGRMDPIALVDLCHSLRDFEASNDSDQSNILRWYEKAEMVAMNMKVRDPRIHKKGESDDDEI